MLTGGNRPGTAIRRLDEAIGESHGLAVISPWPWPGSTGVIR